MRYAQTLFIITAILLSLPVNVMALQRVIYVEWDYPYNRNIAGFRLYHDNTAVCQTSDPDATSMDCSLDVPDGLAEFTLVSYLADGTEGTPSLPFSYIFSSSLKAFATAYPLNGESPLSVSFDGSTSTGDIILYEWFFGDGDTGTGSQISHIFTSTGIYSVTLRTTDTLGASDQAMLSVTVTESTVANIPPTAVISSSSTVGTAPLAVDFDGSGSSDSDGTIQSHDWELGDGGTATGPVIEYAYVFAGTFNATLTVTDNGGLDNSASTPVLVSEPASDDNIPPVAVITASAKKGNLPFKVTFNADESTDQDGEITVFSWNFGDGSTGSGPEVTHTFTQPATYTVTLRVIDNRGAASHLAKQKITVLKTGDKLDEVAEQVKRAMTYIINLLLNSPREEEVIIQEK